MFEVGILLAVDEIIECESRNEKILLRDKYYSAPFYSVSVNRRNFVGGERFFAPLKVFSTNYAVVLSEKNYIRMYKEVFAPGNRLNFYKVSGQSDRYRARRIGTKIVYTETRYFVVSEDERCINALCNLINCVDIEEKFDFQTMNRRFYALTMRFTAKDYNVSRVLLDSEYQLEYAEKAVVLWPPMITCDDQILCEADKLYLHTSFELLSHGNINCDDGFIDNMGNGLYQVQVDDDIKIFRKNAELIINRTKALQGRDLFVSTGTGSGKTECFLWPIVARSIDEAANRPDSFKKAAVRTLIIYPMNALVSDQLARFRKIMGAPGFLEIFTESTGANRIPHFGMYTGRTPYAGLSKTQSNLQLAETYRKQYLY